MKPEVIIEITYSGFSLTYETVEVSVSNLEQHIH